MQFFNPLGICPSRSTIDLPEGISQIIIKMTPLTHPCIQRSSQDANKFAHHTEINIVLLMPQPM